METGRSPGTAGKTWRLKGDDVVYLSWWQAPRFDCVVVFSARKIFGSAPGSRVAGLRDCRVDGFTKRRVVMATSQTAVFRARSDINTYFGSRFVAASDSFVP